MSSTGVIFRDLIAFTAAVALRLLLASAGWRSVLESRPEVGTPLTALPRLREGAFLLNTLAQSPYAGSAFHGQPLLLPLLARAPLEEDTHYVLPFVACDTLSAALLWVTAMVLLKRCALSRIRMGMDYRDKGVAQYLPSFLALAFLWNPLSVLACVGGSSGCIEVTAVLAALCGSALCNPVLAAVGVAWSAYLSPHHALLMVPVATMIWRGPEDITLSSPHPVVSPLADVPPREGEGAKECEAASTAELPDEDNCAASDGVNNTVSTLDGDRESEELREEERVRLADASVVLQMKQAGAATLGGLGAYGVAVLFGATVVCGACLAALSLAILLPAVDCRMGGCWAAEVAGMRIMFDENVVGSWLSGTFGFQFIAEDLTPNFGLWWYLITQMFDGFRPFFLFILNCQLALMTAPLAIRFPNRPVLLFVLHCLISAIMKPYPSVTDVALYMALLPLLYNTLPHLQHSLFLSTAFLSIAALEPALWHLWICVDLANGNLFYAVTLALGAAHVVLINDIVRSAIHRDRLLAGKPIYRAR